MFRLEMLLECFGTETKKREERFSECEPVGEVMCEGLSGCNSAEQHLQSLAEPSCNSL